MKVIVLKGKPDTGKSTVLRLVAKMIMDKYGKPVYCNSRFYSNINNNRGDVRAVFKTNDKVVAITSHGDYPKLLSDDLKVLKNNSSGEIDFFICAMHDTPMFKRFMEVISENDFEEISKNALENSEDSKCANKIFEKVQEFVK